MHKPTSLILENIDIEHIRGLSKLQALNIAEFDILKVAQQFLLITNHARQVMTFDLHEEIEPAGVFRP